MTRLTFALAAAAIAALTITPALADNTCQEEIAKVKEVYATHLHQRGGKDAQHWSAIESAIKMAEKSCAEGKSAEAFEQINLANRWLGEKEHTQH